MVHSAAGAALAAFAEATGIPVAETFMAKGLLDYEDPHALGTVGLALGAVNPGLAGATPPHPTLTGSVADALGILQNNLRVLAVPYLLWLLGFHTRRLARQAGDLLMFAVTAHSTRPLATIAVFSSRLRTTPLGNATSVSNWVALAEPGAR